MAPQREWFEKDYYKVLGVSDTATDKEIGKAYRKLAKQYHPDANPGSEDRFKEVSAAYDVLGDPAKRKEYDEVRRLGPGRQPLRRHGRPDRRVRRRRRSRRLPRRRPRRPARQHLRPGQPVRPGRRAARRAAPWGRSGARIWRPACTCRSSTPSTASPPPSTSPPRPNATPAAVPAPRPAPSPRSARSAGDGA